MAEKSEIKFSSFNLAGYLRISLKEVYPPGSRLCNGNECAGCFFRAWWWDHTQGKLEEGEEAGLGPAGIWAVMLSQPLSSGAGIAPSG